LCAMTRDHAGHPARCSPDTPKQNQTMLSGIDLRHGDYSPGFGS
jgi:hypothetical protein